VKRARNKRKKPEIKSHEIPLFYLPHMEYEGSIGFVSGKMIYFIADLHVLGLSRHKNIIWTKKSDALVGHVVNLPHIGNRECFQFVLQQNLINKA
jgi:hypothetical protein